MKKSSKLLPKRHFYPCRNFDDWRRLLDCKFEPFYCPIIEEWIKWWNKIFYSISLRHLKDMFYEVKYFIQRGKRGFSDRDMWAGDYWIAKQIAEMAKIYKKDKMGLPASIFPIAYENISSWTQEEEDVAVNKMNSVFNEIIWAYETHLKIYDNQIFIPRNEDDYYKIKAHGINCLTMKEKNRYLKGLKLFPKHLDLFSD